MRGLIVCDQQGTFHNTIDVDDISEILHSKDLTIWLDIKQPTEQDLELLRNEFHFHPLAIEDATRFHERPKVDVYPSYYFIVFYAAQHDSELGQVTTEPIYLFVGPNYLVSVHRGAIKQVEDTLARWQAANSPISNTVGALLYALLDSIVDDYFPVLDGIADRVEELEDTIFNNYQDTAIEQIFALKKDLLKLRRVVAPERDVMNVLLRRDQPVFQSQDIIYLQDVYDHVVRVSESIDTYRDLLSSALDSFLSLQSNRLNQIVKVLTIASIVLMSNALIAGIYGMNFDWMPELRWTYGYPFALGLMAAISVGLVLLFKRMRWL
jgi:magnesium transporter